MCGEMAADPRCTLFLLGIGLDELSMGPLHIPVVKQLIRSVSAGEARVIAEQMLRYDTVEEIKGYSFARLRELGLIEVVESLA
jgi:phosphoenolpyruvate-protein kinase (PTS system EI component)